MTGVDRSRREVVVGAFVVAFAVGVLAPLAAVVPAAGWNGVVGDAAAGDGAVLAGLGVAVGVGLVVAAGVRQAEGFVESLSRPRWLLVPGGTTVAWTLAAIVVAPPPQPTALLPFAVAFVGCVLGMAAWVLARDAHDRARREAARTVVAFEAPLPRRARRWLLFGGALTVAGGLLAAGGMVAAGDVTVAFAVLPMASSGIAFVVLSRAEREVHVADEGLFVNRSLRDWRQFDDVRVADDQLVVTGSTWYHGTLRFDATTIEDVDAVVAAVRDRVAASAEGSGAAGGQSSPDS